MAPAWARLEGETPAAAGEDRCGARPLGGGEATVPLQLPAAAEEAAGAEAVRPALHGFERECGAGGGAGIDADGDCAMGAVGTTGAGERAGTAAPPLPLLGDSPPAPPGRPILPSSTFGMGEDLQRRSKSWWTREEAPALTDRGGGIEPTEFTERDEPALPGCRQLPMVAFGTGERSLEKSSPRAKRAPERSGSAGRWERSRDDDAIELERARRGRRGRRE